MSELLALAERVEKAAGADRELDFDTLCLVDPRAAKTGPLHNDPKYTTSLDAAMTLVPDGWGWLLSQPNVKAIASGLLKKDTPVLGEVQYGCEQRFAVAAATPALALTAAALRARHALAAQDA